MKQGNNYILRYVFGITPPFDRRDAIDEEIYQKLLECNLPGLRLGLDPISLMPNSSGHANRLTAIQLLNTDIRGARKLGMPDDLIRFGITKALEWRSILSPDSGSSISIEDLEKI